MKTILVTGGAGFVGSHLSFGLKVRYPHARVLAFDNLKRRGSELNLPRLRAAGVEFLHGDVRAPEDLDSVGAVDLILECSAEPSVMAGYTSQPDYLVQTNLVGALHCLELARRHAAAFIFLSTSRVYPIKALNSLSFAEATTRFDLNDSQPFPGASGRGIAEDFPIDGARSLYGATKLCSELLMREYMEMYGIRGVINRCGVIAGPWQMGKVDQGVVVLWVARHVFGGKLTYFGYGGHGKQVRDLLHVDDLLDLVLHQIEHLDALSGKTFNVGGGKEISASLCELTELCREVTGQRVQIESNPATRVADIPLYITDNARVTAATGWTPRRPVRAIVEDITKWVTDNKASLRAILE